MTEEWRPIPGYEGWYEVSDQGRVRSLDRVIHSKDGRLLPRRGVVLKRKLGDQGYPGARLCRNGSWRTMNVHALVCKTFRGQPQPGQEVRHLNGDKTDNRLENLVWGSRSEQRQDDIRNGVHHMAKRSHCSQGHPYTDANTYYRQRAGHISRVCRICKRERDRLAAGVQAQAAAS